MEAFRALSQGMLPPAGATIRFEQSAARIPELVHGYSTCFLDSGTSALAAAVSHVLQQYPQVCDPKVIIPGYCCPDLVSAILYAGATPVAVDTKLLGPGYDLDKLAEALSSDVVAVIAVNFLGIPDNLSLLAELLTPKKIALIEDNAQWFPAEAYSTQSDYVVFSFGRGKPLSLLGGGAVCSQAKLAAELQPVVLPFASEIGLAIKIGLYNLLLAPRLYGLVERLPFLTLGQTVFHPMSGYEKMDNFRLSLFSKNHIAYRARKRSAVALIREGVSGLAVLDLAGQVVESGGQLLRYPLLLPSNCTRDRALSALLARGIGASSLYRSSIPDVLGVEGKVVCNGNLPGAKEFAGRLITLPVHERVTEEHCKTMIQVLGETLA